MLHNEELCDILMSPSDVRIMKPRNLMIRNAYRIFVGKRLIKRLLRIQ